jgi:hypothetical protein
MSTSKKPGNPNYLALGISLGVALGTSMGVAFKNIPLGLGVGIALGVSFGTLLQAKNRKANDEDKR